MEVIYIIIGVFTLIGGYITKVKRKMWFHQGLMKRNVDIDKYTNYMGTIDLIVGGILLILGVVKLTSKIDVTGIILFTCAGFFLLTIYGEIKYKA